MYPVNKPLPVRWEVVGSLYLLFSREQLPRPWHQTKSGLLASLTSYHQVDDGRPQSLYQSVLHGFFILHARLVKQCV